MSDRTSGSAREIVVVGGGIGGLTTALALARQGRSVRVLERAARFAEVGAGLQLAPNATRVLRSLGVLDAIEEMDPPEAAEYTRQMVAVETARGTAMCLVYALKPHLVPGLGAIEGGDWCARG